MNLFSSISLISLQFCVAGLVIIAVASLLALAIGIAGLCGSSEVHTFEWSRRGAAPTLSLVRTNKG